MSALGHKRTYAVHKPMSALPSKADLQKFIATVKSSTWVQHHAWDRLETPAMNASASR